MNPDNYGTREACQRLVDSGIVLDTDHYWYHDYDETWKLSNDLDEFVRDRDYVPAPSMAEVWRELPDEHCLNAPDTVRYKMLTPFSFGYHSGGKDAGIWFPYKDTPTDALIYLLIWVTQQRKEGA